MVSHKQQPSEQNEQDRMVTSRDERPDKAANGRESGGRNRKRSARELAVLALLTEKTLAAASKRAGIGERTLRRWVNEDAEFKTEYDAARRATFTAGINRVQAL